MPVIDRIQRGWRKAAGPFHEFGLVDGALYAVDRVLRSPSTGLYVYDLMAQPIGDQPLLMPNRLKNLRFASIGRGHPDIDRMPARTDIKAQRFEQGAECLGAYRNDVLIGFVWFCTPVYEEDEVRCTYRLMRPERAVFDFDMYVFPEYRMGTAFMAVWHGANVLLHKRGIAHTFSRVTRFNLGSRRAHAQLGAVRIGVATFLKLWQLEIMVASVSPWVAVNWQKARRIELQISPRAAPQHTTVPNGGPTVE
ncbi:MAG: hypothetical protein ABJB17_11120 [Burkholderiales bacterium]